MPKSRIKALIVAIGTNGGWFGFQLATLLFKLLPTLKGA